MHFIMDYQAKLVKRRNDLSFIEMYETVEKVNEVEVRYESQQTYISSRRFPCYK